MPTVHSVGTGRLIDPLIWILRMTLCPEFLGLPPLFFSEVFLLCVSQHLRQLRISAVIGQDEDYI